MTRLTENKIILVRRKTRLQDLIARHNTIEQARFYIEHLGSDFSDYVEEDACYTAALKQVTENISAYGRLHVIDREHISGYIFGMDDVVVALGQDGLVANTLKYLDSQPLIGVNPDPRRWDGILLPFLPKDLPALLPEVFTKKRPIKEVSMAKAALNDGQSLYAVNDFFIGRQSHVSSRYCIQHGDISENQSSSGIIVSTALGASGWLKSVIAGARGIMSGFGVESNALSAITPPPWNADYLQFTVREPFPSRSSAATVVFGRITADNPMRIISQMPESGVIFSDGVESDFLEFRSGVEASITIADKRGYLIA